MRKILTLKINNPRMNSEEIMIVIQVLENKLLEIDIREDSERVQRLKIQS